MIDESYHPFLINNQIVKTLKNRGQTFLYMQKIPGDIDVINDPIGAKLTLTIQFIEV